MEAAIKSMIRRHLEMKDLPGYDAMEGERALEMAQRMLQASRALEESDVK